MSSYAEGQVHQLANALETAGYSPAELTAFGQNSNGILAGIKLVLAGVATIVLHCLKLTLDKSLNPAEFIDEGWAVWKGSPDGDGLSGEEDAVSEPDLVDFEQIVIETHLREGETSVHGEEKMKRARASKNLQLGDKAFLAMWNNWIACKAAGKPEDSILECLRRSGKIGTLIYFFGRILRRPDGSRCVLYLYFCGREWLWGSRWLDCHWDSDGPSASFASV